MVERYCMTCGLEFHDDNYNVWSRCPRCTKKVNLSPNKIIQKGGANYISYWNPYLGQWEEPCQTDRLSINNSFMK